MAIATASKKVWQSYYARAKKQMSEKEPAYRKLETDLMREVEQQFIENKEIARQAVLDSIEYKDYAEAKELHSELKSLNKELLADGREFNESREEKIQNYVAKDK